ncbi:MAG: sulfite exporter TauE/SafE family protein [Planctomycetaceae bacterium]
MPEFDWTTTSISLAVLIGGIIGLLSGLFGVGGGFLLVPFLNVALGVPLSFAVGSTACYTIGPATAALLARRPTLGFLELPLILAGGLFAGVWLGTTTLTSLQNSGDLEVIGRRVPALDLAVISSYSILMTVIAVGTLYDSVRGGHSTGTRRRGLLTGFRVPPVVNIPDLRPSRYSIPLVAGMGTIVGFLSGFLGMSGGLILVPAAVYLLGLRVHDAATMTIAVVWLVSVQSTVLHAVHGNVQLPLVAALLTSGTIGASVGSHAGQNISAQKLHFGFGLLVLGAAGIVVARLLSLFRG